jgi:hypothetical protein
MNCGPRASTTAVKVDTIAAPSIPFPSVWVEDKDLPRALTVLEGRAAP